MKHRTEGTTIRSRDGKLVEPARLEPEEKQAAVRVDWEELRRAGERLPRLKMEKLRTLRDELATVDPAFASARDTSKEELAGEIAALLADGPRFEAVRSILSRESLITILPPPVAEHEEISVRP